LRHALLLVVLFLPGCVARGAGEPTDTVEERVSVCASGTTLEGVDVSVYDGTVDWTQVKASGRAFGIAKASEGSTLQDSQFTTNWAAMKSAGIVRSAYHFFHCDTDPTTQATFFLGILGTLQPGDLPPSLDFEDTTTCTAATGIAMAVQWLDAVASATGTLPILYTSVNVLSNFQNTQALAGHAQLWVASRGVTCPNLPAPFTAWSFWQYSLTGTAPGLPNSNGMADLDQFNGDMSALMGLTVGGSDASTGTDASAPACMVGGVAGTCIDTSVCASMPGYVSTPGLCPGPASEQCCTRSGDAGVDSDASADGGTDGSDASSGGAPDASDSSTGEGSDGGSPEGHPASASGGCAAVPAGETTGRSLAAAAVLLLAGMGARRVRRGREVRGRNRD
jgi:lysozyme